MRQTCARYGLTGAAGIARLKENVRIVRPDASDGEIAHFVAELGEKKRAAGDQRPLAGLLISGTSEYFESPAFDQWRASRRPAVRPKPCAECRKSPIPGMVRREYRVASGVFAGEERTEMIYCNCELGRQVKAVADEIRKQGPSDWVAPEVDEEDLRKEPLE